MEAAVVPMPVVMEVEPAHSMPEVAVVASLSAGVREQVEKRQEEVAAVTRSRSASLVGDSEADSEEAAVVLFEAAPVAAGEAPAPLLVSVEAHYSPSGQ